MNKRKSITEIDKLKNAQATAKRSSSFLDEELSNWENGKIDREMMAAGMATFISAMREVFRIENDLLQAKIKRESEQADREEFNRLIENECLQRNVK